MGLDDGERSESGGNERRSEGKADNASAVLSF